MKFKVGQMVRAKGDRWFNKGELLKIVELDRSNKLYRCKGTDKTYWQNESDLEPFPQTLEGKLELFKAGTHVLHTPTQEIYDKLMVELEKRGYALVANEPLEVAKYRWRSYRNETCIRYAPDGQYYGKKGVYVGRGKEIIELTPEDFKDSEQEEHMKITIETDGHHKTTAECNGITAESLCNPMDDFKLPKGVHMAVQRLLEKLERPDEDTCFHVGDTVEVVGCHNGFLKDVVGKRGVVINIDEHASEKYEIKYGENISGDNRWWSHPEELKLISKKDASFHVGDIVEVLGTDTFFLRESVGLQGKVKGYDKGDDMWLITLPIDFAGNNKWWYRKSDLKLIRRGNN